MSSDSGYGATVAKRRLARPVTPSPDSAPGSYQDWRQDW